MSQNGDSPFPPMPFDDLPPLSDSSADLPDPAGELPDWLQGALPLPDPITAGPALPEWPMADAHDLSETDNGRVNLSLPGDDTLSDFPIAAAPLSGILSTDGELPLPPLPELKLSQTPAPTPKPHVVAITALGKPPTDKPAVAKPSDAPATTTQQTQTIHTPVMLDPSDNEYTFRATIKPTTPLGYDECEVTFALPKGVKQVHANRKPLARKGLLKWTLGPLAADGAVQLTVKIPQSAMPASERQVARQFVVTYRPRPSIPLVCQVSGPDAVAIGDTIPVTVTVTNQGTIATGPITVRATPISGGRTVVATIESISALSAATVAISLMADREGAHRWQLRAEGGSCETAYATFTTNAVEATITCVLQHESMMRVDDDLLVSVMLANPSPIRVRQVTTVLTVPEELSFVAADGGEFDATLSSVGWLIGDLEANTTRTVTLQLRGFAPGLVKLQAQTEASAVAPITSISNLFVEVGTSRSVGSSLDQLLASMNDAVPDVDDTQFDAPAIVNEGTRHLLFELADTAYAVPIANIREVIRPPKLTTVPGVPEWLPGVANIRGDIVSIIDLPGFLGIDDTTRQTRALLICDSDDGQMRVGLLVNEVVGIRRLPAAQPLDSELLGESRVAAYIRGVSEYQNQVIPLLELNTLLLSNDLNLFAA